MNAAYICFCSSVKSGWGRHVNIDELWGAGDVYRYVFVYVSCVFKNTNKSLKTINK
jgi:hypothetical protein